MQELVCTLYWLTLIIIWNSNSSSTTELLSARVLRCHETLILACFCQSRTSHVDIQNYSWCRILYHSLCHTLGSSSTGRESLCRVKARRSRLPIWFSLLLPLSQWHWLLHGDKWKWMFSIVLLHSSSDLLFGIQSDVAVVWVTIRLDEIEYSLSLVKDILFIWNMFQSFPTKLQ